MYFSQNERRRSRIASCSRYAASLALAIGTTAIAAHPSVAANDVERVAKAGVIPTSEHAFAHARLLGHQAGETRMQVTFALPLRNQSALNDLLRRLYDRNDPLYGKYLTPKQFAEQFGASQQDADAVVAYAKSVGLAVDRVSTARNLITLSGPTSTVENAFRVRINRFLMPDGRVVFANDAGPQLPAGIASRIQGVIGLSNITRRHHAHHQRMNAASGIGGQLNGHAGNGPSGGLTPDDIKKAYNLDSVLLRGEGQTVALYELDGYDQADVQAYAQQFNLGNPSVTAVPVEGFSGLPQSIDGQVEVVLDIDMVLALAPALRGVLVYEGDINSDSAVLATWQKIADDNLASVVSTSWGTPEQNTVPFKVFATAEESIFQQMATLGITIFDASGDAGAFDNGTTLSVDDPAGHPTVTGVGGTTLTTKADGTYGSETVWKGTLAQAPFNGGGSGGGVSVIWTIPSWQTTVTTTSSKINRNVPDVALNADPATGYDIYSVAAGGWVPVGGTSAAAPLWAGFTALLNEQRSLVGLTPVGFFNPAIYASATNATVYPTLFNDVTVSDNLFYAAGPGYDNATGWGSFKGAAWIAAITGAAGKSGALTGTVADITGAPVTTALVTVYLKSTGLKIKTVPVDPSGVYSFPTLTAGPTYQVIATAKDYEGQIVSLTVTADATTSQDFTMIPAHLYSSGLQMISAPEDYTNVAGIGTLLAPEHDGITYSPLMYAYVPYQNSYVASPSVPADTLRVGQAYWVRFPDQMYITLQGIATPTNTVFRLPLQAGWNMIGNPFPVNVNIQELKVDTLASSGALPIATSTLVSLPLYSYDQGSNAYVQHNKTDVMQPYVGYWLFAKQACQLVIAPPGGIIPTPPTGLNKPAPTTPYNFRLRHH